MEIKRDRYLNKLISFMWDGQVKVITGIRRCGKSYLLHNLFRTYLLEEGVPADHILSFELDLTRDIRYRNPLELANRVREIVENQREQFYLFVDEIQMSDEVSNPYNPDGKKITFYDTLNDFAQRFEVPVQSGHLCDQKQLPDAVLRHPHRVPGAQRRNSGASAQLCGVLLRCGRGQGGRI